MSFFAHFRTWLKGSRKSTGKKARQARYRPLVEALEDRTLLSVSATPIFIDDFNQAAGSLPVKSTWTYNNGSDPNNTAVHYVNDASTLSVVNDPTASDGKALAMTIYPTSAGNWTFNSARINTSGNPGANVQYGLIEARIKLPGGPNGQGDGLWPAFWMLGSDHKTGVSWPNCGEIDIMEQGYLGAGTNVGSTHFGDLSGPTRKDTSATYTLPGGQSFYSGYHTFAAYWTPGSITFSVDGTPYSTVLKSSYSESLWNQTFNQPYYMILNICDGGPNNAGGFGGPTTARSTFPQTMKVDYVRAYSLTGITTPTTFTATVGAANTVDLSWQAPAKDETGFVLQRSKTADFAAIDASFNLAQGAKTYQDTTASAGTTYYYRLQAVATDGVRTYQSGYTTAMVTTTGAPTPAPARTSFVITNQTGQPVNFALYGIDNNTGQWSYFSGPGSGSNNFSGTFVAAQQLGAGKQLPTYTFSGSSATLNLPATPAGITSAAMVLTVGDRAPSITVASNFTLPRPAPSNPTLVNSTTNPYYDFIEFTLDRSNTLFINTTQVDQFGFPITLASNPQAPGSPVGVTPGITRDAIFQAFATFLTQETDAAARDFLPLIQTASAGSPYRIIAPGQYLAMPGKASDPLNHYFDSALASFFSAPPSLKLTALNPYSNGDPATYTFVGTATTHNPVAGGDLINGAPATNPSDNRNFAVIDFVGQPGGGSLAGVHFYIYSPINSPSWVGGRSAGEQVFANNGVFADNGSRFGSGLKSIILGNLENQVVSALTRGIANIATPSTYANTTAFWTDPARAFPSGQKANLYAKFLHTGKIDGKSIFIDGRVYAFPYSDQGDQAAFFGVHNPNSISITLGPWSGFSAVAAPTPPATPFANTLYLRSGGTLAAQPGAAAQAETIASAGGINHDGVPTNALVYQINGLTAAYDPAKQTQFNLFLDAGTKVANGTQVRVSYDFTGDGAYDRVETYRYFAEDNRSGWEAYTQAAGLRSATGAFANLKNGSIKLEVWNAIGQAPVLLRVNASAGDMLQSQLTIPFAATTPTNPSSTPPAPAPTPVGNTLYLSRAGTPGAAGALSSQPGTGAQVDTIASAGGINRDGTPTNALVYLSTGLTGTYDPTKQTQFSLFLDAGQQIANGTQIRISYDFNGDGTYDRVETYRYFAEDNRTGWEAYTQAAGMRSATGAFANLKNGSVKVEVWNAIGKNSVSLRTNAANTEGEQSLIRIPFVDVTRQN